MMKSILISIKPRFVAKILNGEKTIEVRKSKPKCDLPIDVYIYCTTTGKVLYKQFAKYKDGKMIGIHWNTDKSEGGFYGFNGRVVAKFTLNKVEEIICRPICGEWESYTKTLGYSEISQASCLKNKEIVRYLKGKKGYAWFISNLEVFDRPRELGEFKHYNKPHCDSCPYSHYTDLCDYYFYNLCQGIVPLTKAPQSYQFIEVGDK